MSEALDNAFQEYTDAYQVSVPVRTAFYEGAQAQERVTGSLRKRLEALALAWEQEVADWDKNYGYDPGDSGSGAMETAAKELRQLLEETK